MNFEKIYTEFKSRILRFTFNYTRNYNEQEELVQEIFFNIFRSLNNFKNKSQISTYIYSIARNTCLNYIKGNIRERKKIEKIKKFTELQYEANPYEHVELSDNSKFLLEMLDKIPDENREIFFLAEIEKLKYREISEIKKIPIGTVKSRLNRAKEKIVELLKSTKGGFYE